MSAISTPRVPMRLASSAIRRFLTPSASASSRKVSDCWAFTARSPLPVLTQHNFHRGSETTAAFPKACVKSWYCAIVPKCKKRLLDRRFQRLLRHRLPALAQQQDQRQRRKGHPHQQLEIVEIRDHLRLARHLFV